MKVSEKLYLDINGLMEHGPINIVILGDSISHGGMSDYIDYENVYWNRLRKMLNQVRDYIPVNMINASIGGTCARQGVQRLENGVLNHRPDLVIVCFGLNDVNGPLQEFTDSLSEIFSRCQEAGADVIYMTPNMLNTRVAEDTDERFVRYARKTQEYQNEGRMDQYMQAAVALAKRMGVPVCDCYARWKELAKEQDITLLLCNRINHPAPEMHQLFAQALFEMILGKEAGEKKSESTMYAEEKE